MMIDKIRKYNFLILSGILLAIIAGFYFLFTENHEKLILLTTVFISVIGVVLLLQNIQSIPFVIAFMTPLSLDFVLGGGTKLSLPLEGFILFVIFYFFLVFLIKKPENLNKLNHPITWLLSILILVMCMSSLIGDYAIISIKKTISQTIYILGFFVITILLTKKTSSLSKLYFWYAIGMIIPIGNSLYKHANLDFVQSASVYTAMPFYDEHTIFGACVAFLIPFVFLRTGFFQKNKIHFGFCSLSLFLVIAVLHSYSRASWISLSLALLVDVFILLKGKFNMFLGIIAILVSVIWFNYSDVYSEMRRTSVKYSDQFSQHLVSVTNLKNDASNRERINRWVSAYRMFEEKPLLGHGPGTYQFEYGKYQTNEFTTRISTHRGDKGNAHSEYLMFLSETGILGFIIFLLIILKSFQVGISLALKKIESEDRLILLSSLLGLTTFYVHGLFNAFSDSPKMAILFLGSLAILTQIDIKYKIK